jgi:hypothetical protein
MNYTLTSIKSFTGREGYGLNAVICENGKPVAFVLDDASGGPLSIDFKNPGQSPKSFKDSQATYKGAEARCLAWALTWYASPAFAAVKARALDAELEAKYPSTTPKTELQKSYRALETWVNSTADEVILAKKMEAQLKRWAKTKTVFKLKGDKPGEYRTLGAPVTQAYVDHLMKKHGEQLEMIYGVDLTKLKLAA